MEFVAALERLRPRLAAFVRRQLPAALGAKESSSDLVQSVFREVLQSAGRIEYQGDEALRACLFMWAANKIRDRARFWHAQRRDIGREIGADADQLVDGPRVPPTPSRTAILNETIARIEAACDRLPEEYRTVITLSRIAGWSNAEIAAHLHRSEGAVKMLLYRAMVRLTTELERLDHRAGD
jgi:RNA polymerase sigma-70 factor (ECF subfamily)